MTQSDQSELPLIGTIRGKVTFFVHGTAGHKLGITLQYVSADCPHWLQ